MNDEQSAALNRLIAIARRDTGQSRRVAAFLLAWWDAESCGGYDITDAWGCDHDIVNDIIVVFLFATRANRYPDTLGYAEEFERIVKNWRPHLLAK